MPHYAIACEIYQLHGEEGEKNGLNAEVGDRLAKAHNRIKDPWDPPRPVVVHTTPRKTFLVYACLSSLSLSLSTGVQCSLEDIYPLPTEPET